MKTIKWGLVVLLSSLLAWLIVKVFGAKNDVIDMTLSHEITDGAVRNHYETKRKEREVTKRVQQLTKLEIIDEFKTKFGI